MVSCGWYVGKHYFATVSEIQKAFHYFCQSTRLDTLNKTADLVKKIQEIEMNAPLASEVNKINQKLDQELNQKWKTAYQCIQIARNTDDIKTREQNLTHAESLLLGCLNINSSLEADKIPNSDIMAIANYGLAIIYLRRGDQRIATLYILKVFESGPRMARRLAPEIYTQLFGQKCGNPLPRQVESPLPSSEDEFLRSAAEVGKVVAKGATWVAAAAIWAASLGRISPSILGSGAISAGNGIDILSVDPIIQQREFQRMNELEAERIRNLDQCCQKTATEYLTELHR